MIGTLARTRDQQVRILPAMFDDRASESAAGDSASPRVSADDARRIVADILTGRAMDGARVEFGVGKFLWAPPHPLWLVFPRSDGRRVGGSMLFAICPQTGSVIFEGRVGE